MSNDPDPRGATAAYVPDAASLRAAQAEVQARDDQRRAALAQVLTPEGELKPSHPMHPKQFQPATAKEVAELPEAVKLEVLQEKMELLLQTSAQMVRLSLAKVVGDGWPAETLVVVIATLGQPMMLPENDAKLRAAGLDRLIDVASRAKFATFLDALGEQIDLMPYKKIAGDLRKDPDPGYVWVAVFDGGGAKTYQIADVGVA